MSKNIPLHTTPLWNFELALNKSEREYIKSYYHAPEKFIEIHTHNFYEINIITSGRGTHVINEKAIEVSGSEVIIIPPGVKHGYINEEGLTIYHILLSEKFTSKHFSDLKKIEGFSTLFEIEPILRSRLEKGFFLRLNKEDRSKVNEIITEIEKADDVSSSFVVLFLISLLAKKMAFVKNGLSSEKITDNALTLIESMEQIELNFSSKLNCKALAKRCAFSYSTYLRLFKKHSGLTPLEYQRNCQLKEAIHLLHDTSETVSSIADKCGFYDSAHFIKEFKKKYNCTPTEYRKNRGN